MTEVAASSTEVAQPDEAGAAEGLQDVAAGKVRRGEERRGGEIREARRC